MIDADKPIHIMDGNKISKQFIIAVLVLLSFSSFIGFGLYTDSHRYDVFLKTIKLNKMTLIKAEEPINARGVTCPYQIHFEAINSSGQKIRARYCGGFYFFDDKINIKEILSNKK